MSNDDHRPVVLVVLDGWGYREEREGNAIRMARVPTWDRLWSRAPRTLLDASGLAVGLPEGQMGNSEVGHLNLGAGRVVMQDIVRIDLSIRDGSFFRIPAFTDAAAHVRRTGGTLHLMIIGEGGVQRRPTLFDFVERERVPRTALHALLDGRDTLPKSALGFMEQTVSRAAGRVVVASLGGRYFGMDRDKRWERTKLWYDAAVLGVGPRVTDPVAAIRAAYERGETDEFIKPMVVVENGEPIAPFREGDALICFNFRSDRMRQIVRALTDPAFDGLPTSHPKVPVATMTSYDQTFSVPVAFSPQSMARIVAETLAEHGLTSLRTAETEKYAHVTYFFNGGIEVPYAGEERILVPSQKVATYDLMPEMSAPGITDVLCRAIETKSHEFILCNYANGDMVGHTGSIPATLRAVETVDACSIAVVSAERAGARLLITAIRQL
jgi:2,3-bisphosphoglycerate-independent phosphoglycerate mutase